MDVSSSAVAARDLSPSLSRPVSLLSCGCHSRRLETRLAPPSGPRPLVYGWMSHHRATRSIGPIGHRSSTGFPYSDSSPCGVPSRFGCYRPLPPACCFLPLPAAHCLLPFAVCFLTVASLSLTVVLSHPPSAFCFFQSDWCSLLSARCCLLSDRCIPPSAVCHLPLPSAVCRPPVALFLLPSALCPLPSTAGDCPLYDG